MGRPEVYLSLLFAQAPEASLWEWLQSHENLLGWMFGLSLASLVLTALLLPVFVVRLPADYFVATRQELAGRRGVVHWIGRAAKNGLGLVFLLAGIAMLVLPGQGLLTMLIGLLLLDFPGKRAIEHRLVRRPTILAFLNRIRARRGREPLRLE
ncbi:MAG TPA: PGPGW domain-containing protein [Planctomycetota bacterium]|nr:PGPGW domain-containing protein [Planctomycetota bacterium]